MALGAMLLRRPRCGNEPPFWSTAPSPRASRCACCCTRRCRPRGRRRAARWSRDMTLADATRDSLGAEYLDAVLRSKWPRRRRRRAVDHINCAATTRHRRPGRAARAALRGRRARAAQRLDVRRWRRRGGRRDRHFDRPAARPRASLAERTSFEYLVEGRVAPGARRVAPIAAAACRATAWSWRDHRLDGVVQPGHDGHRHIAQAAYMLGLSECGG